MAVPASTLDLPMFESRRAGAVADLPGDTWLARSPFGYAVWRYDDAVAILLALVDEGDEVVMFEPWFDIYQVAVDLVRGVPVGVPLRRASVR